MCHGDEANTMSHTALKPNRPAHSLRLLHRGTTLQEPGAAVTACGASMPVCGTPGSAMAKPKMINDGIKIMARKMNGVRSRIDRAGRDGRRAATRPAAATADDRAAEPSRGGALT